MAAVVSDRTRVPLSQGAALLQRWDREYQAAKRAPSVIWPADMYGWYGEPPPVEVTATPIHYRTSEAVNAAVKEFANRIASTALLLYKHTSTEGEREEVKAHPALTLLRNPNPFLRRWDLLWHTVADLKLAGNAYWFLAGPHSGAPVEIWRCAPQMTRIVRSTREYIGGYVTEIDSRLIPLRREEVIHFRAPNPVLVDTLYGLGDLAVAALAAQTGREMAEWNRKMFARDFAVPAGVVNIETNMSDSDYERMKAEWRTSYGGKERRTAFLRGGKVQFQPIGLSQKDVDFLEGAKWEAEKIYRVFGTYHLLPAEFADDRKVNERQFLENHAWPLLSYVAETLTDEYFSFWGPRDGAGLLEAAFEDIRPRERALDLEEEREEAKGITLNEWRAARGKDPLDGGDDVLFVHVQAGDKVKFEVDALPPPPEPPAPPPVEAPPDEPPPPPEAQDAQENAEERESAGDEGGDDVGEVADKSAVHRELAAWERFALRRVGQPLERTFKTETIPPFLADVARAALTDCQDGQAIKTVFARLHDLAEGRWPGAKSSYGPPSGTVVLTLSDVEDILLVQQVAQRSMAADAPARWTPREQLHVTVIDAPLVDEPAFRQIFQETVGFAPLDLRALRVTTFEGDGEAVPIVALVDPTDALRALHELIWAGFAVRGIAVSEYSQPDLWTPHITLGYVERAYRDTMGLMPDLALEFGCRADTLAFTRGEYETIHARAGGVAMVALPESTPEPESMKAIQATRLDFESEFETLLAAGREAQIDRREWASRTRTLLRKYGEKAYRDGLADGGVTYGDDEPLAPEDRSALGGLLTTQSQYVTELGRVLFRSETGVSEGQAAVKPGMWFNKSVLPLYQAGRLSADKNGMYLWVLNPLKQNCRSCHTASGQVHRLGDWHRRKIVPKADTLICKGFACGCNLLRAEGRAVGRLDSVPLHAGKAEHEEGTPMVREWPEGFPADIKAELTRVFGRRILDLTAAPREADGPAHYVMTLREDAGYYAKLTAENVQTGLSMIDPRLTLMGSEITGETDLQVIFAVEVDDAA